MRRLIPSSSTGRSAAALCWFYQQGAVSKTICFADVIRRMQPKRAMVLAHREELIFQAQRKIEQVTGLHVQVEMAAGA